MRQKKVRRKGRAQSGNSEITANAGVAVWRSRGGTGAVAARRCPKPFKHLAIPAERFGGQFGGAGAAVSWRGEGAAQAGVFNSHFGPAPS